jgi:hypothetical protein
VATRDLVKAVAQTVPQPASQIIEAFFAASIKPGKNRCYRMVGFIQQNTVVHESADADGIDRRRNIDFQRRECLSQMVSDGVGRKGCRALGIGREIPLAFS